MTDDSTPQSPLPKEVQDSGQYIEVSREQFESVPVKRGRYILTYLAVFAAWVAATLTQFYYTVEEVPLTAAEKAQLSSAAQDETGADEAGAPAIPETRVVYSWKWSPAVIAYQIALAVGMLFFYTQFASVLRLMGYPWLVVFGYCSATLLPLPGVLAVAWFDRQIAKTWNKAEEQLIARDRARGGTAESG